MQEIVRPLDLLRGLGFRPSGTFRLQGGRISIFRPNLPSEPGLYIFVEQRVVRYVGQTTKSTLDERVHSHTRKEYHAHRKVGKKLPRALESGHRISILTLALPPRHWKGLEVSDTFGVEQALIERFHPHWN